ncbi:hypothetical protein BDR26DRAFT_862747 [Obelidium mucronatum]|nr:hypothetical protein BDR26DRAFT_862747 [Obelidium mucronatum]
MSPSEIFGMDVFDRKAMSAALPKPVYQRFCKQVQGHQQLDRAVADAVAHAARVHKLAPTAEKHDSFLTLKSQVINGQEEIYAIDAFSGGQLLQSEPDASSFPNGGMRSTFEARGYTIWDTVSPMFVRRGPHGTAVLYIPSVFISYNGEALDEKTSAVKLLQTLGDKETKRVTTTLGCEQEFFFIDRGLYNLRPDLKITGRTLIGVPPPKHQQLEDHYFGAMPSRVLACIAEAEYELARIGVPIKTRHNEVAPNQFEVAPIFEEASIAVDHNLATMEVLHQVAHRHKLKVLFHEKPFKGVNGSGKHANWSMQTDTGDNLLEPTSTPETNYRFLLVLVAILDAVYKHGGLLRSSIASSSNEHRLGANEAPPAIVSAFLGAHLSEVLNAIEEKRPVADFNKPISRADSSISLPTPSASGSTLDLNISTMPPIARDLTDRNRTSPFAFTGNKFEYRAVGSKQSPSFPVVLLNAAVSKSLELVNEALIKAKGSKAVPSEEDILSVIRQFTISSKKIRFEENGYSDEWVEEAARRGLPNIKSCPEAFKQLISPASLDLLISQGILSAAEINSRYHIQLEKYAKDLLIEGNTLHALINNAVLPAAFAYRKDLAESINAQATAGVEAVPEKRILQSLTASCISLTDSNDKLAALLEKIEALHGDEQGVAAGNELTVALEEVRSFSDAIEAKIGGKYWPLPSYTELLL